MHSPVLAELAPKPKPNEPPVLAPDALPNAGAAPLAAPNPEVVAGAPKPVVAGAPNPVAAGAANPVDAPAAPNPVVAAGAPNPPDGTPAD